jgi:hypothetical protein
VETPPGRAASTAARREQLVRLDDQQHPDVNHDNPIAARRVPTPGVEHRRHEPPLHRQGAERSGWFPGTNPLARPDAIVAASICQIDPQSNIHAPNQLER